MLNTALLSRMSQKSQHTRYEEIILGRTCCEEAPQFVPACSEGIISLTLLGLNKNNMVGPLSTNGRYHFDHKIFDLDGKRYQYVYV